MSDVIPDLVDAYFAYAQRQAQAGVLDHTLVNLLLDGLTMDEAMREVLRLDAERTGEKETRCD